MQVFEFHFNPPKTKTDLIFDSFCYEPENVYEKRLGSLYMLGFLKNVLPQNVKFLDNLAKLIKDKFYRTISVGPDKSLKETLRSANEYLEKIAKSGDVSWLGNLGFAVISLKDFELNFTKVGELKIFLLRRGKIIDIDQKLEFDDIEPYPLKIFGNIVSGKLAENDIILLLTKDVSTGFSQENLLNEIAKVSFSTSFAKEPRRLKEIFNGKKEQLSKTSGICLAIVLSKEAFVKEREILIPKKTLKIFSFKEVFSPLIKVFKIPKLSLKIPKVSLKIPQIKLKFPKLRLPKPKIKLRPQIKLPQLKINIPTFLLVKKINLVLALIFFSALGFFIFQKQEERTLKIHQEELNQVQEKVTQAETYLILAKSNPQAEKKANSLFRESWTAISPLANIASTFPEDFAQQVLDLKKTISENLYEINKLVEISEPELIFEFSAREFIPQRIISFKKDLYFFSPYSENVFLVNQKGEGKVLSVAQKFNSAIILSDSLLFFSKPNQLINFKEGDFQEPFLLENPYSGFNFNSLSSYQFNLYFLDNQNGKIIKYPYWGNFQWSAPQSWLSSTIKNATDFRSMAVDGSVWILTKDNSIQKYYAGRLQETLNLDIFPSPKVFSKILTSSQLPYLYLLEPVQKRIIVLNRSGEIIKQYQSEKFDNLLDFTVSEDGKTIYFLNGLKIYRLSLSSD